MNIQRPRSTSLWHAFGTLIGKSLLMPIFLKEQLYEDILEGTVWEDESPFSFK
jgi:hypothetical protein